MATTKTPGQAARLRAVAENPKYQKLIAKRTRFGWTLTVIMLIAFFGYIGLIAFDKAFLAQPIGDGVTSLGIPVGFGIIILTILLTGIYVVRANPLSAHMPRTNLEAAAQ